MNCPKCPAGLLQPVSFRIADRSVAGPGGQTVGLEIDQCASCGGVWFDADELERFTDAKLEAPQALNLPEDLRADVDARTADCPRCAKPMEKKPAPNNPRVTADRCPACAGLWLDAGELARVTHSDAPLADRLKAFFATA